MVKKILFLNYICVYNTFCWEDKIVKKGTQDINKDYYYFDFPYQSFKEGGIKGFWYAETKNIKSFINNLNNENTNGYKNYYIDTNYLYKYIAWNGRSSYYKIIRRKIYKFDNYDELLEDFKQRIKNDYFDNFWLLISELNNGIPYNYNIKYKDLSEILEIEYNFNDLKFSLKLKDKIDPKYLKPANTTVITTTTTVTADKNDNTDKKNNDIKTEKVIENNVEPIKTATINNIEPEKVEIKKNIKLKKVVNENLAPDVENEFKDLLNINDITKKDDISNKIFDCLYSKFDKIKKTDYELYSDESGKTKLSEINFDSNEDNYVVYVKIKDFYLTNDQKNAVEELSKIDLEDKDKNIYSIYKLIDKINSNIDKIKAHQFCKNFIKKYNNETDGLIKEYNAIIATLTDQCKNTIKEINGIDETSKEDNIENLKDNCIQNFKKAAGDYGSKKITGYIELSNLVADCNKAIEELDTRINLYKEYKDYETTVKNKVSNLLENINTKPINEITNFENFNNNETVEFKNNTKLKDEYSKYDDIFKTFIDSLNISFNKAINDKKNEFEKIDLKNEKSKEIFDEINKSLDDYQNLYSNINNIEDKKLNNSEETIEKEIKSKIDKILTNKLEPNVDNNNEIEKEIRGKFNAEDINTKATTIVDIINNKKETLKIKFTLRKKNTENLKDEYSAKFNNIVNIYKEGVRNNVKFSELRSEISEKNDIKLFKDANEVNYNENIVKDSVIFVEFPDSYLVKIEIPKPIDKENNDPNKKDHTDEGNKNQENIDNSDIKNNTTTKKKCSNSGKEKTNNKKSKKTSCKQK